MLRAPIPHARSLPITGRFYVAPLFYAALAALSGSCVGLESVDDSGLVVPLVTGIQHPNPWIPGTYVDVEGQYLDLLGSDCVLVAESADATVELIGVGDNTSSRSRRFQINDTQIETLVRGIRTLRVHLEGNGFSTNVRESEVTLARGQDLPFTVDRNSFTNNARYHRNQPVVFRGQGFVMPNEGQMYANFEGTFSPVADQCADAANQCPTVSSLPGPSDPDLGEDFRNWIRIEPTDETRRDEAALPLTTALGRAHWAGIFQGTVTIAHVVGDSVRTATSAPWMFAIDPVEVRSMATPPTVHLGEYLSLEGAGFLGGASRSTEVTLARFVGTFTEEGGAVVPLTGEPGSGLVAADTRRTAWNRIDIPIDFELNSNLGWMVNGAPSGANVSTLFQGIRGTFQGVVSVITRYSRVGGPRSNQLETAPIPLTVNLRGTGQHVHLRFMPGFYQSLAGFGLTAAAEQIKSVALARMNQAYAVFETTITTEFPTDVLPHAVTTVEVSGPDLNGGFTFGYESTPGKDSGNLILGDYVGGYDISAERIAEGSPYGGVFIESLLYFSSHPELPLTRPDPCTTFSDQVACRNLIRETAADFDEIFDPVRRLPARLDEVESIAMSLPGCEGFQGDGRLAQVCRAVRALGSMVGETSAHELGHSLGLAQPNVRATALDSDWHATGSGCLMAQGGSRSIPERSAEPGVTPTRFCGNEPTYLCRVLLGTTNGQQCQQ